MKRGPMQFLNEQLPVIISLVTSLITGVGGFLFAKLLELRKVKIEEKESNQKINSEQDGSENERFKETLTGSQRNSEILISIIEPLSGRIAMLENDSTSKQKQIFELNEKIIDLTKIIHKKNLDIEDLNRMYLSQVEISNEQEKKILAQAVRIRQLECELEELKKKG